MSMSFNIRSLQSEKPFLLFSMFFILAIPKLSFFLKIVEGAFYHLIPDYVDKNMDFSMFSNSLWNILQTATTVGYGDLFPISSLGRAALIMAALIGVACSSILTIYVEKFSYLGHNGKKVYVFLERIKHRKKVQELGSMYSMSILRFLKAKNKYKHLLKINNTNDKTVENQIIVIKTELENKLRDVIKNKKLYRFEIINFKIKYEAYEIENTIASRINNIYQYIQNIQEKSKEIQHQIKSLVHKREKEFILINKDKLNKLNKINNDKSIMIETIQKKPVSKIYTKKLTKLTEHLNTTAINSYVKQMINHNNEYKLDEEMNEMFTDDFIENIEDNHFHIPKQDETYNNSLKENSNVELLPHQEENNINIQDVSYKQADSNFNTIKTIKSIDILNNQSVNDANDGPFIESINNLPNVQIEDFIQEEERNPIILNLVKNMLQDISFTSNKPDTKVLLK